MKGLKKNFWSLFSITFVVLVFFWKVVFKGLVPIPGDFIVGVYYPWLDYKWGYPTGVPVKNPIMADVVSFSYPMRMLAVDLLKSGKLPLWNPYILMGTPLLANFQSAPFSPTNFVYFIFDRLTAWSFQIILQHLLAAFFTYFLLRHWKVSKWGSVLGGIIFAFSGFSLIWSQWNAHTLVAAFIPLLILFADKFLITEKIKYGVFFSICLALQVLSGYPQLVFYSVIAIGILWFVRKKKKSTTILLGVFGVLGLALSMFQILPGYELLKYSQRAVEPHPFEWAFLPWIKTITFFASDFFGNHATANYWGPQDYTSNTGYVGVVAILLSIIALKFIKVKKEILICGVILVTSLLLSFPTPVSILLWKSGVFGFNAAAAHRALVLFTLSVSLLAGFGFDYLIKNKNRKYYLIFISVFVILVGFGIYALKINQPVGIRNLILPSGVLVASFIAIKIKKLNYFLIALSILELFYFGWKFTPFSPRELVFPETPVITFLKTHEGQYRVTGDHVIPINLLMAYKIKTVEGYDAVYPSKTSEFINSINNNPSGVFRRYGIIDNDTSPLLDDVNTKYYLALKTDPDLKRFDTKRFRKAFEDKSVLVYESLTVSKTIVENEYKSDAFFNGVKISLVSGVILLLLYLRHRNEK